MKSFLSTHQKRKNLTVFSSITLSLLVLLSPAKALAASHVWPMPSSITLGAFALGQYCAPNTNDCTIHADGDGYYEMKPAYVRAGRLDTLLVSINYSGTIKNNTTNLTSDTVAVKVGDSISFLPKAVSDTDISWT